MVASTIRNGNHTQPMRRGKVWLLKIYNKYTCTPQYIYMRPCKCIWQIFTLTSCKCKNNNIHSNNTYDLHFTHDLHAIYTTIDNYRHTRTTLVITHWYVFQYNTHTSTIYLSCTYRPLERWQGEEKKPWMPPKNKSQNNSMCTYVDIEITWLMVMTIKEDIVWLRGKEEEEPWRGKEKKSKIGRMFFAMGIGPGQKWWWTLLGREISCTQWEGPQACTQGALLFFPFKFGEFESFFSFFPGSQCVCSHYVLNGFSSHSQYIPQVLNEFPNMFSLTLHFYPIFFGKCCPPFTYICGPKGGDSILQS